MNNKKLCINCQCLYPITDEKWSCSVNGGYRDECDEACKDFIEVEYILKECEL